MRTAKNIKGGGRRKDRARLRAALRAVLEVRTGQGGEEPTLAGCLEAFAEIRRIVDGALSWDPPVKLDPVYVPAPPPAPPGPETARRLARLDALEAEGKVSAAWAATRRREIPTEGWDDPECPACGGPCEFPEGVGFDLSDAASFDEQPTTPWWTGPDVGVPLSAVYEDADEGHGLLCHCRKCD